MNAQGNAQVSLGAKVQSRLVRLILLVPAMDLSRQEARPATSGQTVTSQKFPILAVNVIVTVMATAHLARSVTQRQESAWKIQSALIIKYDSWFIRHAPVQQKAVLHLFLKLAYKRTPRRS